MPHMKRQPFPTQIEHQNPPQQPKHFPGILKELMSSSTLRACDARCSQHPRPAVRSRRAEYGRRPEAPAWIIANASSSASTAPWGPILWHVVWVNWSRDRSSVLSNAGWNWQRPSPVVGFRLESYRQASEAKSAVRLQQLCQLHT